MRKSITNFSRDKIQFVASQERNLLSVAYKNVVGARRSSWRVSWILVVDSTFNSSSNRNPSHLIIIISTGSVLNLELFQVISSIEQKTEGSEKKQQLAKEYREKVSFCSTFEFEIVLE